MSMVLDRILVDVRREVRDAKAARPESELRRALRDAPAVRPFVEALSGNFGLIAEIKERSPSVGPMRRENIEAAPAAYQESSLVRAVSILTNQTHFGMGIDRLAGLRESFTKPILRKDFFIDPYQIPEARAAGADAILLMANVLSPEELSRFHNLALELGMEALFEVHTADEIDALPASARIVGINSRKFRSFTGFVQEGASSDRDFSLDFSAFDLADRLPPHAIKVAESGLTPANLPQMANRFSAALVGTSLLRDVRGPTACLADFEAASLHL